jgi:hypothetical protein
MAILEALPGVGDWITANGEDLREHNDPNEELIRPLADKMVVTYIEAVSSVSFAVNLGLSSPFKFNCQSIAFLVEVGGIWVAYPMSDRIVFWGKWTNIVEGTQVTLPGGKLGISKFSFAEIKTGTFDSFNLFSTADIIV